MQISHCADRAHLELVYERTRAGATRLARRYCRYPFSLTGTYSAQRSHTGPLTVVPQSASGGLFAGDDIREHHRVGESASMCVLDQGSTVVHGARNEPGDSSLGSSWRRVVKVGAYARADLIASPIVLLPGARLELSTSVAVHETATVVLVEGLGLHEPAVQRCATRTSGDCGEASGQSHASQSLQICRTDLAQPLVVDRFDTWFAPNEDRWFGTIIIIVPNTESALGEHLMELIWHELEHSGDVFGGATYLPNEAGLAVRLVAASGGRLKDLCSRIRCLVDEAVCTTVSSRHALQRAG